MSKFPTEITVKGRRHRVALLAVTESDAITGRPRTLKWIEEKEAESFSASSHFITAYIPVENFHPIRENQPLTAQPDLLG